MKRKKVKIMLYYLIVDQREFNDDPGSACTSPSCVETCANCKDEQLALMNGESNDFYYFAIRDNSIQTCEICE